MEQMQTMTDNKPRMLTIPQLTALGILPGRAIRRLVAEGEIPTVSIGNRQYINLTVFERYCGGQAPDQPKSWPVPEKPTVVR
jgi:hypothetical protein